MAEYRFLTTWVLDASAVDVWKAIYEIERWPEWWPGVEEVTKLRGGRDDGVGAVFRHRWRSRIPYVVEFDVETTCVERLRLIAAAARGKLAGTGTWRFWDGSATAVTYEWNVATTAPWMNAVAPVARPVFEWNHHAIMRWGGEGLARRLGARLLARS
jgi:Polyketide cyclase / dehydrase and lipid transport